MEGLGSARRWALGIDQYFVEGLGDCSPLGSELGLGCMHCSLRGWELGPRGRFCLG